MNTSKSVYCHVSRSGQGKLTISYVTFWKFDLLYNSLSNTIEVSCERKDDYHIKVSLIGNNSQTYLTQTENALFPDTMARPSLDFRAMAMSKARRAYLHSSSITQLETGFLQGEIVLRLEGCSSRPHPPSLASCLLPLDLAFV